MEPSFPMWTDKQTDRHDEANSRFSQFCLVTRSLGTGAS
jgi:hypothetical protein